ncbi:MAG: NAD(P)/FAD-dependent oxidoreductase [Nitrospirae bacterium]|nr:NAD(P)/FAD-dependent oxidoreductase [Nitrospirota bacterium]
MKKYDDIVVGSGISGMTMSLILGMNGRKVLLLEKAPHIGGSISVFYRNGIPFDTGFHFTGGLQKGGMLHDMLSVLGLYDLIQPVFLPKDNANSFYFESENRSYEVPYGFSKLRDRFKNYFPSAAAAVDKYFDKVQHVCAHTPSMNLRTLTMTQGWLDEDFVSLQEVLNSLTGNAVLKALLSGFAMCYGVRPREISFASHSRICFGLYESVSRIKGGGASLIEAFKNKFKDFDIEVACSSYITEITDIRNKRAGRFVLNTGEEIESENCILTIHPKEILKLIPDGLLSKAFISRVSSFEASAGFFALFAALDSGYNEHDSGSSIVSLFPHTDINRLLDPEYKGAEALVIIRSTEEVNGKSQRIMNVLGTSFIEHVKQWESTARGKRPQAYQDYKQERVESIKERIFRVYPDYKEHLTVIDSASVLSFRDYLNSHDGSAYGIKQKAGQYNLIGKLPVRNMYAAGQSSLLPGIIGAMMSSFVVGKSIIKDEKYSRFMSRNLCS